MRKNLHISTLTLPKNWNGYIVTVTCLFKKCNGYIILVTNKKFKLLHRSSFCSSKKVFFVKHRLYSSEDLSKIYQILSEFAFDSCQSRIIYAEKETAVTGQIKNFNGYIVLVTCLTKNV
jgi:hypothetical protein